MTKVVYSPKAELDLIGIQEYISINLGSPIASKKLLIKIARRVSSLIDSPELGAKLSAIIQSKTNFRYLVCDKYLVFYIYDAEHDVVSVVRVLYGGQDYLKYLL